MSDEEARGRKRPLTIGGSRFSGEASAYNFLGINSAHKQGVSKYLKVGWKLLPVDVRTNEVALPDGVSGATGDKEIVKAWAENPDFSLGVATGLGSGIVGLRCRNSLGEQALRMLLDGEPITALKAGTAGISYYFFRAPEQRVPSRVEVAPGIDVLGEGGAFVLSDGFWFNGSADLASVPDNLLPLFVEEATAGFPEIVAARGFALLNLATPYEAAQAYGSLGWKLHAVDAEGNASSEPQPPELWREDPANGIGLATGAGSGVVGLNISDTQTKFYLEATYGPLPLPFVLGTGYTQLFRAPSEQFPSKGLFQGVEYIGEDSCLVLPPSTIAGASLKWEVARDFSPGLPELPKWLHDLLLNPAKLALPSQPGVNSKGATAPQLGDAALRYAAQGWLVFPLKIGGKTPLTKNGLHNATRNRDTISQWWQKKRSANIGVQTGAESGLVVLDVDVKNGQPGKRTLADLEAQHGRLETLRAHTPTGGLHLFFRAPAQEVRNRAGFLPGLDLRGQGGYIVVAPSRIGGQEYRWDNPTAGVAEMPEWLLALANGKSQKNQSRITAPREQLSYREALAGVQEGSRNDTVFRFACKLRQEGWEYDEALVLVRTAANNCEPPLPEDETIRCLDSAWRYAPPTALTDLGNAERFVARCGDRVRYVPEKNRWLVWSGHWWETNLRAVSRMARSTVRSLRDEAEEETDPERRNLLLSHGRRSESAQAMERMLDIASLELLVRAEDLDRPGLVAFANGVLDVATGTFRPGRREDLLTKHETIPYNPTNPECFLLHERQGPAPARKVLTNVPAVNWEERLDSWMAERCDISPGPPGKATVLREDFSAWLATEVTARRFGDLLCKKGFSKRKSNVYVYDGLRLRS